MCTPNRHENGGARWTVAGTLDITDGGRFLMGGKPLSRCKALPDSEAKTIAELAADYNALLAMLRNAGMMEE